ncbi:hypothetical protein TNCV_517921 [Trichonephila clavipes]|nr:hypothetical protein TNCV_517921 [Trichonephila clavipes]
MSSTSRKTPKIAPPPYPNYHLTPTGGRLTDLKCIASLHGVRKCMKNFFSGHIKNMVYETLVPSVDDLIARISVAAERICDMLRIFQNLKNSMQCRC